MTELTWEAKDSCKSQEEKIENIDATITIIECMVEKKRGLTIETMREWLDEVYDVVGLNFRCLT